jgi:cytochrome c556
MQRKWTVLAAAVVSVTVIAVGLAMAQDEDSPLHKIMEEVNKNNLIITKGVRNAVSFKKEQQKVVTSAKELVTLAKKAREREYGEKAAQKQKKTYEDWTRMIDAFTTKADMLVTVASKSGATQAAAKKAFTAVKAACTNCHNDFRVDENP